MRLTFQSTVHWTLR